MKLTAWDILHQDGGEYAEDIERRHKLIEDAIDKGQTILRCYDATVEPVRGFDLYEKLYELEKAGLMPTFEADYDKYERKSLFKMAGLEPVCYDILDLQNRRDLLAANIFVYNKIDFYNNNNMQEALDQYERSLHAGQVAVLAYAIMDGQKICPEVLPDNDDTLTLKNLKYFMDCATDHYIGEVVSEVAYNMRNNTNICFDHSGLIDLKNGKADPKILEDAKRYVKFGDLWKEKEPKMAEIGSITCSSEYLAGGDIARNGYTSTYYQIGDKYYEDYANFDDYGEEDEEPIRYETEREKIVKEFAEAYIHENTYTDVYAGNLDALADESFSYEIKDEQLQKEVERYAQDIKITKHTKEEHDSLKDIWLGDAECPGDYSNSHVGVQMFIKDFTDADQERFEDLILGDKEKRRLFGSFKGAFYAGIKDHGDYKELFFDLNKGDFEAAKRLSKIYPEAVVFVNDGWDEHNFAIFKDGKEYNDYTVEWGGDEPEPYREDWEEEDYYECDVNIEIKLPFNEQTHTCYSGGGHCYEEEFEMYKEQVETHPKEQCNEEKEL